DFFGQMVSEIENVIPDFMNASARLNLQPLSEAEAREAIVQPLENLEVKIVYNVDFVDEVLLSGLMAHSVEQTGINPPHLQIVCNQLYEAAHQKLQANGSAIINAKLYEELGGVETILQTYLDRTVEDIAHDPEKTAVVRSMLKVMIETVGTRKFVSLADLRRALPDVVEVEIIQFLDKLRERRVIELRQPRYSLSHEFMVEKVRSWFDEREMARQQALETLQRGVAEWQASEALLNEKQVETIRQWLADELTEEEQQLLDISEKDYQERKRREEEQKRQLEAAKAARQKATYRWLVVALILLVISMGFGIDANNQKQKAAEQARTALAEKLTAQSILADQSPDPNNGYDINALLLAAQAFKTKNIYSSHSNLLKAIQKRERQQKILYGHSSSVTSLMWIEEQNLLASGSNDQTIRLWDVETQKLSGQPLEGHSSSVSSLIWIKGKDLLASGSDDGTICLWDVETQTEKGKLEGHSSSVTSLMWIEGKKLLASGSYYGTIRLWDVETQKQISILKGHEDSITNLILSPDEKILASGVQGKTIRLWDVEAKKQIGKSIDASNIIAHTLSFISDYKLAAVNTNAEIQYWDLNPDSWLKQACSITNRNFSQAEWEKYIGNSNHEKTCEDLPKDTLTALQYIQEGEQLAEKGNEPEAIAKLIKANELDPNYLHTTPEQRVNQIVAANIILDGEKLAKQGEILTAMETFKKAKAKNPDLNFNPEAKANEVYARAIVNDGLELAKEGEMIAATQKITYATTIDRSLDFSELKSQAQQLYITTLTTKENAANGDNIHKVLNSYQLAEKAINTCEKTEQDNTSTKCENAMKDALVAMENLKPQTFQQQKQQWVEALENGQNPFTDKLIKQVFE
ncbi:hypothetical protein, partial [Candidatus Albibeggiatoa sp. nov. NOAA]|uniref:WD40 repeat domain-containing protein n=1 Tax=Candidatus Albibeggiatoa sp. nov. NOAA TaxID=3162724 RepID=UPI003301C648|nr:hypothetical protein [Thiotrichaceae bacterium]